jgi:hypothetical protein
MTQPTIVFEGIEVRPTGRTARKQLRSGKYDILHEVAPVDKLAGAWRKWIRLSDAHEVIIDDTPPN